MRDPHERETTDLEPQIGRLQRRADFLRAAKGRRWHAGAMTVQAAPSDGPEARVGFTLTRKVGNAVVRNRARRRLKEAVRLTPALPFQIGHDYVIIGRIDAVRLPFEALQRELAAAVAGVHRAGRPKPRPTTDDTRPKKTRPAPVKNPT